MRGCSKVCWSEVRERGGGGAVLQLTRGRWKEVLGGGGLFVAAVVGQDGGTCAVLVRCFRL